MHDNALDERDLNYWMSRARAEDLRPRYARVVAEGIIAACPGLREDEADVLRGTVKNIEAGTFRETDKLRVERCIVARLLENPIDRGSLKGLALWSTALGPRLLEVVNEIERPKQVMLGVDVARRMVAMLNQRAQHLVHAAD